MNTKIVMLAAIAAVACGGPAFAADASAAAATARTVCAGCHGPNGISVNPIWPNLAGQHAAYLAKAMRDFKAGERKDPNMAAMLSGLSDADIDALAAYYASLPAGG